MEKGYGIWFGRRRYNHPEDKFKRTKGVWDKGGGVFISAGATSRSRFDLWVNTPYRRLAEDSWLIMPSAIEIQRKTGRCGKS
jgi:hypothetical protein